jgi:hypothetical protein
MKGNPLLELALGLFGGLVALLLVIQVTSRPVAGFQSSGVANRSEVSAPALVEIRVAHRPDLLRLSIGSNEVSGEWFDDHLFEADITIDQLSDFVLGVSAEWNQLLAPTFLEVSVLPEGRSQLTQGIWVDGALTHRFSFRWRQDD